MPKNGPFACSRVWPLPCCWRDLNIIAVSITSLLLTGCGGGEDFSKPPAQIQNQLAKTAQDPAAPPGDGTETAIAEGTPVSEQHSPATDAVAESAATPASDTVATNGESPAVTATPAESPAPATTPAPVNTKPVEAAPGDGAEVMTASGSRLTRLLRRRSTVPILSWAMRADCWEA
ncbi:MAG: hypothetical protein WKF77_18225 [Planctomycetaceae bacterium]